MKFATSFLLFTITVAEAAPIRIFYEVDRDKAQTIRSIFVETYFVPEDLIELKKLENCGELKGKGRLDLCLKNNGDLEVVSVDKRFINESLKIFSAP